jgi:RNase P/RNase MRP subunit p29
MDALIGKKVRAIIQLGETTIPVEGIIRNMDERWVEIEVNKKKRIVNKDIIAYIEEKD